MNPIDPADAMPIQGPAHTLCPHKSCADIRAGRTSDQRIVAWLLTNIDAIRLDETASDIYWTLVNLAYRVERAVDNHDPDVYCGPCEGPAVDTAEEEGVIRIQIEQRCGADLYSHLGDTIVTCSACGTSYPVEDLQAYMLDEASDQWARPRAIVGLLRTMGEEITYTRVENWISRDRREKDSGRRRTVPYPPILQVGIDDDGKALYRVGDFLDRIEALRAIDERKKESA